MGVSIAEAHGGVGLDTLGNCLVEEELAQIIIPLLLIATQNRRKDISHQCLTDKKYAYLALMEPGKEASQIKKGTESRKGKWWLYPRW